jgi:hypothetical protein
MTFQKRPEKNETTGRQWEPSNVIIYTIHSTWGNTVVQWVEALRYKSEDLGLDSRWSHWNFLLT